MTISGSPRVLFQSHNRRGLGHLMRALNVAREIRNLAPEARIVLHTRNPSTAQFCPPDVEWVIDASSGCDWASTVRAVDPDVVVYDTLIPDDAGLGVVPRAARVAYVMRRSTDERHRAVLESRFLDRVDIVVVPHDREEFDRPVPADVAGRLVFVGPIVRSSDPVRVERLRRQYRLGSAQHTIVSCAGGGGFAETAEPFFDAVWDAHERLARSVQGLHHIVVLGPHNADHRTPRRGMRLVDSEPHLVDLFALADLVVSEGGYNAVHEIRHVGVPGCFVPGRRRWDDQDHRVRALQEQGLAVVIEPGEPSAMGAQIAALACSRERLDSLRRRTREVPVEPGNQRAAQAILGHLAA